MEKRFFADEPLSRQQGVLAASDKLLLELVQQDIALEPQPFVKWAELCGLSEEQVLDRLHFFLRTGLVREISALLDKSKLGYKSTLVAARIKDHFLEKVVSFINRHPGVSHNYLREHTYNLWFTLSIRQEESFQTVIENLLSLANHPPFLILEALKTFKLQVHLPFGNEEDEPEQPQQQPCAGQSDAQPNRAAGGGAGLEQVAGHSPLQSQVEQPPAPAVSAGGENYFAEAAEEFPAY
jgi:DNA-binding Lrp family transcriptional regulator